MVFASVTGVFKMILMVIGGLVLLRFIGQLLIAKRNLQEEKNFIRQQRQSEELNRRTRENLGKTSVISSTKSNRKVHSSNIEDVDFEEA
jgi:hypothetical protein